MCAGCLYYWPGAPILYPCWEVFCFFFLSFELQPTLCLAQTSTSTQYIVCFLLFAAPPIQAEVIILQLCTRAPVSGCSPQVMDSVSGMSDPLRWLFSTHALWRVIPLPLRFNLGTQARPAAGQRLYKQRLGVAALSVLLMEEKPVWFLRVFHIFVS